AGLSKNEKLREQKKLEANRNYIMFLTASVGNLIVPVGVEQLKAMALETSGMEEEALVERRRRALWALATLGENVKRFDTKLSEEAREKVMEGLRSAANGPQRKLAEQTIAHLEKRSKGQPDTLGVGAVLAKCADDGDPSIRYHA